MAEKIQSDRVFDLLRREILACRMPPSSKIRIPTLCTHYEVSLGAVREALSRLISDGLVINEPQKGFTVSPVSVKALKDLTEARIALEEICLTESCARGDVEWESQIVAAFHRLSRIEPADSQHPGDLTMQWSAAHEIFHHSLVAACDNAVLHRLRGMLYAESERYRHWCLPLSDRETKRDVGGEHKAIMEATLARDAESASELTRQHFQKTVDILLTSKVFSAEAL